MATTAYLSPVWRLCQNFGFEKAPLDVTGKTAPLAGFSKVNLAANKVYALPGFKTGSSALKLSTPADILHLKNRFFYPP
jgi:hypothetical protein